MNLYSVALLQPMKRGVYRMKRLEALGWSGDEAAEFAAAMAEYEDDLEPGSVLALDWRDLGSSPENETGGADGA